MHLTYSKGPGILRFLDRKAFCECGNRSGKVPSIDLVLGKLKPYVR
jgi:hypothetical protein